MMQQRRMRRDLTRKVVDTIPCVTRCNLDTIIFLHSREEKRETPEYKEQMICLASFAKAICKQWESG
jgi:hypothetical protein